ncbi:MAG: 3-dehydroquinate synthase [Candidatus Thorarchaeota archaeon]|nr:3-dehydroquinate synthase [Candidatus Thorarchaeota archaeon]
MVRTQFSVAALSRRYTVFVGDRLLESPDMILDCLPRRVFIVTDSNVAGLYLEELCQRLREYNVVEVHSEVIPAGEQSKTLQTAERLYAFLAEHSASRTDMLIALGGGVVGDVTGFVASTFKRGLPLVQIPTTLVAQVDSSLGGKTGINLSSGKNVVGTFYQPEIVLADIDTLTTLPEREYVSGLAEVIKYGVAMDPRLFRFLESNHKRVTQRESSVLRYIVERCLRHKARVVERDEREERGEREILNFGHTVGHALEICSHLQYSHGEAVAIGIVCEALLSVNQGLLDPGVPERIRTLLSAFGLPTHVEVDIVPRILNGVFRQDKKTRMEGIQTPLLRDIGHVKMQIVRPELFLDQLTRCEESC